MAFLPSVRRDRATLIQPAPGWHTRCALSTGTVSFGQQHPGVPGPCKTMDHRDIKKILRRYTPLDLMVRRAALSTDRAHPGRPLRVTLAGRLADRSFLNIECGSVDGRSATLASADRMHEARQTDRLLGFDADGSVRGAFEWPPGAGGTAGSAVASCRFGKESVDFALVRHREWFPAGQVPDGLPDLDVACEIAVAAEVEITIFGGDGLPSPWAAAGDH